MAFYVYILKCRDDSYYAGHTDNIEHRLAAHHEGRIPGYTASRRPVKLVFLDTFTSREQAFDRERQVKGWSRRKKESLIQSDWEKLKQLAKPHGSTGSP